jgi:hypothetical protein
MDTTKHTKADEWAHPLFLTVVNDKHMANRMQIAATIVTGILGDAARELAKANAEWHDDPQGDPEGHAEMHAPASVQFPENVRHAVACELLERYLTQSRGL